MTQINRNKDRNDAAVAETIGFVLIFGIVMLSMGLIYVMGYGPLQSSMDQSIFESTEQSFIILQTDMKMVAFDQVPVKNLKIQLQSSTLSVTNKSNITIMIDGTENGLYGFGEIEYQKNDMVLTYENGAVFKHYPGGSIMVSNPRIYTDTNFTTIGIVSVNGNSSVGGKGIVSLNMKKSNISSSLNTTKSPVNVTLNINSAYAPEWEKYLNDSRIDSRLRFKTNRTGSNLVAWRNDTQLIVGNHTIDVKVS